MAQRAIGFSWVVRAAALALMLPSSLPAQAPPKAVEVKVERVRPARPKEPTLRFLKANRDWIRGRMDALRQTEIERRADGYGMDQRFLVYPELLSAGQIARDSVAAAEEARARLHLIEGIGRLAALEESIDRMERQLFAQQARLRRLEEDFTGRQQTALLVLVSGYPGAAAVSEVAIAIEQGPPLRVALSAEQRESLKRGGIVEVFHGFVEPREQVVEVTLSGDPWPHGDTGYITVSPERDRLTFLRLDLSKVQPAQGGASVQASTWMHEAERRPADG